MKTYQCICGKVFDNPQKFNGHKSNCKIHQQHKYGSLKEYNKHINACIATINNGYKNYIDNLKKEKENKLEIWLSEKHKCKTCHRVMTEYYGSGIYCSRSCANKRNLNNKKQKISNSIRRIDKQKSIQKYLKNPKICCICGSNIAFEHRTRKTCSNECLQQALINSGKKSASILHKRSKNEIEFYTKCKEYFGEENVLHNEPMFNGWDADIILPQYKLAILWNGPWHYKQVTKTHKLKQVQNRDKIKKHEIEKAGYTCYIIKDIKRREKNKIENEFNYLLRYLNLI